MTEPLEFSKEKYAEGEAAFARGTGVAQAIRRIDQQMMLPPAQT